MNNAANFHPGSVYNFKKLFGFDEPAKNDVAEEEEVNETKQAQNANNNEEDEDENDDNNDDDSDGDIMIPVIEWIGGIIPRLAGQAH